MRTIAINWTTLVVLKDSGEVMRWFKGSRFHHDCGNYPRSYPCLGFWSQDGFGDEEPKYIYAGELSVMQTYLSEVKP